MKKLLFFVSLAALLSVQFVAQSRPVAASMATVGAGPNGYDWLIGTWSCTNKNPSPVAGPANSTFTAARANTGTTLLIRSKGKGFDTSSYLTYASKSKTWWAPAAFADGSYEVESSTGTGNKVTFSGTYYGASGPAMKVRDVYTLLSPTKQNDLGQAQSGGTWKTLYDVTCTKS